MKVLFDVEIMFGDVLSSESAMRTYTVSKHTKVISSAGILLIKSQLCKQLGLTSMYDVDKLSQVRQIATVFPLVKMTFKVMGWTKSPTFFKKNQVQIAQESTSMFFQNIFCGGHPPVPYLLSQHDMSHTMSETLLIADLMSTFKFFLYNNYNTPSVLMEATQHLPVPLEATQHPPVPLEATQQPPVPLWCICCATVLHVLMANFLRHNI